MNFILDFLFPKRCVGCNKIGEYFCSNCILEIRQGELICPFCERASIGGATHPVCIRKYGLDGLWSLGAYQGLLRAAIQKLKYKWVTDLASNLNDLTLEYWAKHSPFILDQIKKDKGKSWVVTAVPLHSSRKNWRGFNQSELLGRILASKVGLEYMETLKRIKNTKPQVKLKSYQRKQNIKNAFVLTMSGEQSSSLNKPLTMNCLLIDDVWTTGATLKECCYVLKKGGIKTVWAMTIAR